jgi:hypothetical protein
MKRVVVFLLLLTVWAGGAEKKKKKAQYAIQIMETTALRGEETISLDGRVRNIGEKPIEHLIVLFDFLAPGGPVLTTQRFEVEEGLLEPGQEAVFRAQVTDPVRAVRYRLNATDRLGRDFQVTNPGPFVIE